MSETWRSIIVIGSAITIGFTAGGFAIGLTEIPKLVNDNETRILANEARIRAIEKTQDQILAGMTLNTCLQIKILKNDPWQECLLTAGK